MKIFSQNCVVIVAYNAPTGAFNWAIKRHIKRASTLKVQAILYTVEPDKLTLIFNHVIIDWIDSS